MDNPFEIVLLKVWREACRHIDLEENAARINQLLRPHLPLGRLRIYWIDQEHSRCLPAAAFPDDDRTVESLNARDTQRLMDWVRRNEIATSAAAADHNLRWPCVQGSAHLGGDCWRVPLCSPHGSLGVMILHSLEGQRFEAHHEVLVQALQEPFAIALENHRRFHELAVLREAAEADRRSLLARLGRSKLAETIVGENSGLKHVMERVRQICRSDVPVLVLGETGTGKELVARALHSGGPRCQGPFIRVNCGAIPPDLIDSHLFGHEKGSFTGAMEMRQGWFERADGGTLFLDEIGELPADAQVRLLRVLQDGIVERVGGHRDLHVDVRVVAATHRDLAAMVANGRFREDLWYRIAVFPILLPPLRDRKRDIPDLVRHFAQKAATRFGLAPVAATSEDLRLLENYDWPGNIRELGTVIDRAAILGDGKSLEIAAALGLARPPQRTVQRLAPEAPAAPPIAAPSAIIPLDEAMRRHIELALQATHGRIDGPHGAARLLKINPHTLRARMRKLGVNWKQYRPGDATGE